MGKGERKGIYLTDDVRGRKDVKEKEDNENDAAAGSQFQSRLF